MPLGTPYNQANLEEHWDAIVIGSGIGGLTAANMLSLHGGKKVLVLERHYEAGGYTHTFRRPGFSWDVGLHYIGEMKDESSMLRRIVDHLTENRVQWQAMPNVYDRFFFPNHTISCPSGEESLRAELLRAFPSEGRALDHYFAAIHACNKRNNLYFAEKAIPGPAAALFGNLMRAPYLRWARQSTQNVLESITQNQELIGVLTAQWGDYGLPPAESSFAAHAMIAQHYFEGASFPVGGSAMLAAAILPQLESRGSKVIIRAEVEQILLSKGKAAGVRMRDGRELRSPLILSDAGATNTFTQLISDPPASLNSLRSSIAKLKPSTAHIALYVGLSKTDAELNLEGTNLWSFPSYDHNANVRRFAEDIEAPFPNIYISFPSAKDPIFQQRHPGKSTVEILTMAPYKTFEQWQETKWKKRGNTYESLKQNLTSRLCSELQKHVPSISESVEYMELSTPLSTRHFMNYTQGEIYGIAVTPDRYALRALGTRTPIPGLYLTGQDAAIPGVVGAIFGGILSASVALKRNLLPAVLKKR